MSDNLRTRIAAMLKEAKIVTYWREGIDEADGQPYRSLVIRSDEQAAEYAADVLIRELNLQPETLCLPGGAILTRLDGKVLADNRYMTRWATPWEADESPVK